MSLKSLAFGTLLVAASSLAACATNSGSADTLLSSTAPGRGDEVSVRNLHATPQYRGGPPLSPTYYKRQPRS